MSNYEMSSSRVIWKLVEGEVIAINLVSGLYYCIGGIGAPIFEAIARGADTDSIASKVAENNVDCADPAALVDGLITKAMGAGLITLSNAPAQSVPSVDWKNALLPVKWEVFDDIADLVALDPPLPGLDK